MASSQPPTTKKARHEVNAEKCDALITKLWKRDTIAMFHNPVSPLEAPGYNAVIDQPMDLSTMRNKLYNNRYASNAEVIADVRLMLTNALEFNAKGDAWYRHAKAMMKDLREVLASCGLAKYDDIDSDDDVFVPDGRVDDKEHRLAKDEKKVKENVPTLLKTLQDDLDIPLDELRAKYQQAASAKQNKADADISDDDDSSDHSSLTSDGSSSSSDDDDDEDEDEESDEEGDEESEGEDEGPKA